jgi:hypothetical protein
MNIIAKFKLPASVPNPPLGYGALFISSDDGLPWIKLTDGTTNPLRGLKGDQGLAGSLTIEPTVTVLPAGQPPSVQVSGTASNATIKFSLPVSSPTRRSVNLTFTETYEQVVVQITDVLVTTTNTPMGFTFISSVIESEDYEYVYQAKLQSVSNGSFVIVVTVSDPDGDDISGLPLPPITMTYIV